MADERFERVINELPLHFTVVTTFDRENELKRRYADYRWDVDYAPPMALGMETLTGRLFADASRTRRALRNWVAENSVYPAGQPGRDYLVPIDTALAELFGRYSAFTVEDVSRQIRDGINGRVEEFGLGYLPDPTGREPVFLVCVDIRFENGSLKGFFKVLARNKVLSVAIAIAAASGPTTDALDYYGRQAQIQQEITTQYAGERCVIEASISVDKDDLLKVMASELNYEVPGLTEVERARRVCWTQIALDRAQAPVGPIDGVPGTRTEDGIYAFAKKHGEKPDIRDSGLRRELAQALHDGIRQIADSNRDK